MTIFALWKLTLLHMKKKFDVVHIHNMPDLLVVAGLISKVTGAILVLDVHDPMSELFQQKNRVNGSHPMIRALKLQERLCYRLADRLVTVTHTMAENVAEKRGCPIESVKVVHNFPDLISFPIREDKKEWPINGDGIVFLFSGTVTGQYRLDIAVRAIAIASQTIPNIRFQILGGGDSLEEVLALAEDLGIGDRVEHIPPVHVDMVKNVMANVDVGITTHQSGIFGDLYFSTKIIEFMTQGLPVISSRTDTLAKYIPDDSIFYFEPGEIGELVNQIILMYNKPGLVLQKINNSKKLLSKYTWQEEKRSFMAFYEELFKMC
jgi:glycosyltransferase involved in cell wall biosynthesis